MTEYLLAIESAVSGGSLALFANGEVLAERDGASMVSRAEDLLPMVSALLENAATNKHQLKRIAVGTGPGSFTGLRIGISTALGLSQGLGIECVGVPLINAILKDNKVPHSIVAVPIGRHDVCVANSERRETLIVLSSQNAIHEIRSMKGSRLLVHSDLTHTLSDLGIETIDIGRNMAKYLGKLALQSAPTPEIQPIYVQNPRFT